MRPSALALTLLSALALSAACNGKSERGADQWPISKDELARGSNPEAAGEATYRQYCFGCHGVDGRGNGGITGADFRAATSPLLQKTDAELLISVRDGKRGATATMPAHKPVLTDAQIGAVLLYVRSAFQPKGAQQP